MPCVPSDTQDASPDVAVAAVAVSAELAVADTAVASEVFADAGAAAVAAAAALCSSKLELEILYSQDNRVTRFLVVKNDLSG